VLIVCCTLIVLHVRLKIAVDDVILVYVILIIFSAVLKHIPDDPPDMHRLVLALCALKPYRKVALNGSLGLSKQSQNNSVWFC
jgi:hypothetical protein